MRMLRWKVLPTPYGCDKRIIESDSCKNSEQNLFQEECFIWKLQFFMAVYNQQEPAFTPLHSSSPGKLHN